MSEFVVDWKTLAIAEAGFILICVVAFVSFIWWGLGQVNDENVCANYCAINYAENNNSSYLFDEGLCACYNSGHLEKTLDIKAIK